MNYKKISLLVIIMLMFLSITACTGKEDYKDTLSDNTPSNDKITIYTTIFPLYDFAKNVGGEYVEVINLIPTGAEPHSWEPSPQDMAKLQQADIFIYCGVGLEPWIEPVLDSFTSNKTLLVDSSTGIDADNTNDHHADPHLWLDPVNAQKQVNNIAEALINADPTNTDYYRQNQTNYIEKLSKLHQNYQNKLSAVSNKKFVTSHAAFGYLAKRYGLEQIPLRGLSAEVEPSPARLAEVVKLCRDNNIKYIFFEHFVSAKVSQTIANEIGGGTLILHPLANVTDEQLIQRQDYISLMEENLNNLLIALGDHS